MVGYTQICVSSDSGSKKFIAWQDPRKRAKDPEDEHPQDFTEEEEEKYRIDSGLVRTGRLFGGLINDIKRKAPW